MDNDSDSFDFPPYAPPPELGPEPETPVFARELEPGSACYTCAARFVSWTGSVTTKDFLTLCRLCTHYLEAVFK